MSRKVDESGFDSETSLSTTLSTENARQSNRPLSDAGNVTGKHAINQSHRLLHGKRKQPEFLCEDDPEDQCPEKIAKWRAEQGKKYEAALEKSRAYRHRLEARRLAPRQDSNLLLQLKHKDSVIAALSQRVAQLEDRHNFQAENESSELLVQVIQDLQTKNSELSAQVKEHEAKEYCLKQDLRELELKYSHLELQYQTWESDRVQSLELRLEGLRRDLQIMEGKRRSEETVWKNKLDDLTMQLYESNTERMKDHEKFLQQLLDRPPMVIVKSQAGLRTDPDTVQYLQDQVSQIKERQRCLKDHVSYLPSLCSTMVKDTSLRIQQALMDVSERNKDLEKKYSKEMGLRKLYHNQLVELRGNIRVYCRVRSWTVTDGPPDAPGEEVFTFDPSDDGLLILNNKGRQQEFELDKVFDANYSQTQVFSEISSLIRSVLDGFNVCIFAYGQTGAGKTHTMEGPSHDPGVNQRALKFLYEQASGSGWDYDIRASVYEIYNETIRDLLNPDNSSDKLEVKMKAEGGLHVPGVIEVTVKSLDEITKIFELGRRNRTTAVTNMNEHSSRSHCLLCVTVTGVNKITGDKTFGRLNLVDLAGSERVSKSLANGDRLKEAQSINKSLSSLGDVINALKNKQPHIPYRNSKLTYLLQESLGGDSKTLMILHVSPTRSNVNESLCSLTFGQRVRSAELGMSTRRVEEGGRGTPSSVRRDNHGTPTNQNTMNRTPNLPRSAIVHSKQSSTPRMK